MGRVYLPKEDLARFGVEPRSLTNGTASASLRPVLEFEAGRAREFYRAADELLPLVDEDSQPALWTLVEIYRRLLKKIAARNYDVFSQRVRLSTAEKLPSVAGYWKCSDMSACRQCRVVQTVALLAEDSQVIAEALAEADIRLNCLDGLPTWAWRASSYGTVPGSTAEVVDNCQHVLLGCCTNLIEFYRRLGVEQQIRWYDEITFILPGGRSSTLKPGALPPPFHAAPR